MFSSRIDLPIPDLLDMTPLIEQLNAIVGKAAVITDLQDVAPYATDWRKRMGMNTALILPTAQKAALP